MIGDLDLGCSAALADSTCGSVSFYNHVGDAITLNLDTDPEYTMSGLVEPLEGLYDHGG